MNKQFCEAGRSGRGQTENYIVIYGVHLNLVLLLSSTLALNSSHKQYFASVLINTVRDAQRLATAAPWLMFCGV